MQAKMCAMDDGQVLEPNGWWKEMKERRLVKRAFREIERGARRLVLRGSSGVAQPLQLHPKALGRPGGVISSRSWLPHA